MDALRSARTVAVQVNGALSWVYERDIVEIDPWPVIDAKLEEAVDYAIREGEDSPKVLEIREWLNTYFEEDS